MKGLLRLILRTGRGQFKEEFNYNGTAASIALPLGMGHSLQVVHYHTGGIGQVSM